MPSDIHWYYYSRQKRAFDVVTAALILILACPLFIIISMMIWWSDGWPIIFCQKRIGLHQKPFFMFKFRTMVKNADQLKAKLWSHNQAPWPMFKLDYDPRFIKFGKFLSKTGLDELPQLFNILKGEMSLIGPRPLPVNEVKQLPSSWNFRHLVRPGVFSEWTLASERHHSLTKWKRLDRRTLQRGGISYDLNLAKQTAQKIIHSLLAHN